MTDETPMTVSKPETVEVTQADRDAAAAYLRGVYGTHAFDSLWAPTIARGAADWHAIVALVVAVRMDTEARLNATPSRQDGLREALRTARAHIADHAYCDGTLEIIDAALSDTPPPDNEETEALRGAFLKGWDACWCRKPDCMDRDGGRQKALNKFLSAFNNGGK